MRTAHLSRLSVTGGDLHDLALLHAEWAVGTHRFASLRDARLAAGMPPDLTARDIAGEVLKVSVPEPGGIVQTSVVRLSALNDATLVEHLVVRHGDPYRLHSPTARAPEVVAHLLADDRVEPRELRPGALARVVEDDVPALVRRALAKGRQTPLVLVSVENATRDPLIDPVELARRLAGMASVHFLGSVRASHRLKDELLAAGFSDKFGCYNGGVRILWPDIIAGDDPYQHLLLLPVRILAAPECSRTEHVAGLFCEMIAEDEDPRAWMRDVDPSAPAPRPRPATTTRRPASPVPVGAPEVSPRSTVDSTRRRVPVPTEAGLPTTHASVEHDQTPPSRPSAADAHDDPSPLPMPADDRSEVGATIDSSAPTPRTPTPSPAAETSAPIAATTTWSRLAGDVGAALELAAELERDLDATRRELVEARQALRRAEQQRDELAEAAAQLDDVADATKLAEQRFPDRLVVLPSAHASAIDSSFRDPERCFRVLTLLALFGQYDGVFSETLAKALGHAAEWKPKDSPSTTSKFGAQRTWTDAEGRRKLYFRHVTLGGSVNPTRCLQVYYDVLPDGRIEIAWIGEHRPTVGKDT